MKENVFLGNEGLTSTSANHYCNIAQECIQADTERLEGIKLYQTTICSIVGGEPKLMSVGCNTIDFMDSSLKRIAEMNSFCAWVREALKKKEALINFIKNEASFEEWAKNNGIEIPKAPQAPAYIQPAKEEEIFDTWDMDKRNKYLMLEAFASTYGKYIHPKGAFSKARKSLHQVINSPIYKEDSGRDLIIYNRTPTIDVDFVDSEFMRIQNIYRQYEKELNAMKAELRETLNKVNLERENTYRTLTEEHKAKFDSYCSELASIKSKFNAWKISECEKISKLKIVLPEELLDTFKELKKYE